jgi:hypothetical protein
MEGGEDSLSNKRRGYEPRVQRKREISTSKQPQARREV